MCNSNNIRRLSLFVLKIKKDGIFLSLFFYSRKVFNKLFIYMIFHRWDMYADSSAKIIGCNNLVIGKNFYAGKNLWIEAITEYEQDKFRPRILIKDNVSMSDFNHIGCVNYVEIGNGVLFGSHCFVTDHNHGSYSGDLQNQSSPLIPPVQRILSNKNSVIIRDNVWIGNNVTILPGVIIGEGTIIGANAVVSQNIPSYSIAVGIPARVIKKWDFTLNQWVKVG